MGQKRKIIIIIKEYTKTSNVVAYHLLTNAQPAPEQWAATAKPIFPSFIADHDIVWNGRATHLLLSQMFESQGHFNTKQCCISGFCHFKAVISRYLPRLFPLTFGQT